MNKAFVWINQVNGGGAGTHGVVAGSYVLLDPSDNVVNTAGCSALFATTDTAATIQALLVANIRDNNNDQTIDVTFL